MTSNRRLQTSLLSLAAMASSFAACGKIEDNAAALEASKITMVQAIKAARAKVENSVPLEVDLEMIEEQPRYNVELATADKVTAVVVDGISGEVIETSEVVPDPEEKRIIEELLALSAEQRVGLISALKKASRITDGGRPLEIDLEEDDGTLIYDIRLMVGNLIEKEVIDVAKE